MAKAVQDGQSPRIYLFPPIVRFSMLFRHRP